MRAAARDAFMDISQYIREKYGPSNKLAKGESWIVTPKHLDTKETRLLNRILGISRVNYMGNTNGKR